MQRRAAPHHHLDGRVNRRVHRAQEVRTAHETVYAGEFEMRVPGVTHQSTVCRDRGRVDTGPGGTWTICGPFAAVRSGMFGQSLVGRVRWLPVGLHCVIDEPATLKGRMVVHSAKATRPGSAAGTIAVGKPPHVAMLAADRECRSRLLVSPCVLAAAQPGLHTIVSEHFDPMRTRSAEARRPPTDPTTAHARAKLRRHSAASTLPISVALQTGEPDDAALDKLSRFSA